MRHGAALARAFSDTVFVLEHAGMMEDMSEAGWQRWREGMAALGAQPNVNVKLSGLGTFVHACRTEVTAPIIRETVAIFGADRLGQQFSDREALDGLCNAVPDIPRGDCASRREGTARHPARHGRASLPDLRRSALSL